MEKYHLVTNWFFHAPVEKVWQELFEGEPWNTWWSCWKKADTQGSDRIVRVGTVIDNAVKGKLPYALRFRTTVTAVERLRLVELSSSGDLEGAGKWVFEPRDGGTAMLYTWDVGTTNPLFNVFGKFSFVKDMIVQNHDYVMAEGYRGLKPKVEK